RGRNLRAAPSKSDHRPRPTVAPNRSEKRESRMAYATIPGYPRIGKHRELKKALEAFWSGKLGEDELQSTASEIRRSGWEAQAGAGLDLIPVNDFSLYDQVLDTSALLGNVPDRYGWSGDEVDL